MKVLAIDSCSMVAACALVSDDKLISEGYVNHTRTHSQKLLPMIENVLSSAECDISEIDLFVCTVGPGSFTGQRIGIATVKGLAQAYNKPCAGVSSLAAAAYNLPMTDAVICPIMDARRGQVYNGLYKWSDDGRLITLKPDRALAFDELLKELEGQKAVFLGDGVYPFADRLKGYTVAPPHLSQIRAGSVAMLGMQSAPVSCHELLPLYLRKSQAEREYEEKMGK